MICMSNTRSFPGSMPLANTLFSSSLSEALQRAILWPNYQPTHSQMIIPPISLQPNSPRLLLETNVSPVDFLTPETIQRHTSQHRILINTCNRKVMGPALIKFEASEDSNTLAGTQRHLSNVVCSLLSCLFRWRLVNRHRLM